MRITDDRYSRDRDRHDLAFRMIHLEARTCTIRACTGLSDDRIRKLYKTYIVGRPLKPLRRRRGKSPRQVAFFTRTLQLHLESSILGGLFIEFELLTPRYLRTLTLEAARAFCDAYETHLQLFAKARISFEHAWFLLELLRTRKELRQFGCLHCAGLYIDEVTAPRARPCPVCKARAIGRNVRRPRLRQHQSKTGESEKAASTAD